MVKKLIMIVDDEPYVVKVVKDILEQEGYATVTASGGLQALSKLKKAKPDLILLDYFMPGMNGLDLCKKIRADDALKDFKIVFLSVARFSGIKELTRLKVLDYIRKPFTAKFLIERVRKNLSKP